MEERQIKKLLQGKNSTFKIFEDGGSLLQTEYYEVNLDFVKNAKLRIKLESLLTYLGLDDINNKYKFMEEYMEVLKSIDNNEDLNDLLTFLEAIKIGELGNTYSNSLMEITKSHQLNNEKEKEFVIETEPETDNLERININSFKHKIRMLDMQYYTLMNSPMTNPNDYRELARKYNELFSELSELTIFNFDISFSDKEEDIIDEILNDLSKKTNELFNKIPKNESKLYNEQKIDNNSSKNINSYTSKIEILDMQYDELMDKPMKDPEDFHSLAAKYHEVVNDLYDLMEKASSQEKEEIMDLINKTDAKRVGIISKAEKLEDIGKSFGF